MTLLLTSLAGLVLASIPALMFFTNLPQFCHPPGELSPSGDDESASTTHQVSVLIPARDEAEGIAATVAASLRSRGVTVEVVVLDDHSSDDTAAIVNGIAASDPRVRCVAGKPLPEGWNGKQFACAQLAEAARFPRLVFLDADVRLGPGAIRRMTETQDTAEVPLLSLFPQQETGTWLEKWMIPLMHWILLGFLPFRRMRASTHPAYAAGCGQVFMTPREAYFRAGTHGAIRGSRHDGVKLPRAYREAGMATDVHDGTGMASCRMYRSAAEVIRGVLKNAVEGIANPRLIGPFTIILLGGAALPWITLVASVVTGSIAGGAISVAAIVVGYLPRFVAVRRLRQPFSGAAAHPVAVTLFVALQWIALLQHVAGRPVSWRGRS